MVIVLHKFSLVFAGQQGPLCRSGGDSASLRRREGSQEDRRPGQASVRRREGEECDTRGRKIRSYRRCAITGRLPIEGKSGGASGELGKQENSQVIGSRLPPTAPRCPRCQAGRMVWRWHLFLRRGSKSANTYHPPTLPEPPLAHENEV